NRQLDGSHPAEIAQRVKRCTYGSTRIENIVHKNNVVIVDIRWNFRLVNDGLKCDLRQIIAVQVDIQYSKLRLSFQFLSHPLCHAPRHRNATTMDPQQDDGTTAVCLENFIRESLQSSCDLICFHELVIELK